MRRVLGVCAVILLGWLSGQAATGIWKNFTSMYNVRAIVSDGTGYWAATSGGLFHWSLADSAYLRITNAEGLQSIDLTAIAVDASGDIWSGASNGLIHVYTPSTGTVRVISDIATARDQTNKGVNAIIMQGDTALICTEFGLTVFRVKKFEFGDTFSHFGSIPTGTRTEVSSALIYGGTLWACISDGQTYNYVATASLSLANLLPPESWTIRNVGSTSTIPRTLAVFGGKLYCGTSSGLYTYTSGTWNPVSGFTGKSIIGTAVTASALVVATSENLVYAVDPQGAATQRGPSVGSTVNTIASDASGNPLVGSATAGILTLTSSWNSHYPNGPNGSAFISVVADQDGIIWAGSGDANGKGMYRFDGTTWTSYTTANSLLPANEVYRMSVGCNGSVWASTYGRGLVEIPRGTTRIDSAHVYGRNTGLVGIPEDPNFIVPGTVVCDSRGNTWMTVVAAADKNLLVVRRADGTMKSFPVYLSGAKLFNLMDRPVDRCFAVDAYDNIWATVRDASYLGVISLGNAGNVDSTVAFHVGTSNGLPSNVVKTIVVDNDNDIWVGTDRGIAIILDPSNPLRSGGIAAYKPLNGLVINCITVDPLNQKWVGTTEGVFLLTADGTQTLASYTVNSTDGKLMDNDVKSIAFDGKTGTAYFGTASGLASLTTAGAAPKTSFDKLTIFPNPFLVPNSSPLTISGLVQNSSLKVMTIDGSVIRDVRTPGGLIGFWDGKDNDGKDVSSGVYLIVAYSEDGSAVANGKVAVIRR
jgi:ligand-binding sensor domain-containing protein